MTIKIKIKIIVVVSIIITIDIIIRSDEGGHIKDDSIYYYLTKPSTE
jgi:hypothetical protein